MFKYDRDVACVKCYISKQGNSVTLVPFFHAKTHKILYVYKYVFLIKEQKMFHRNLIQEFKILKTFCMNRFQFEIFLLKYCSKSLSKKKCETFKD